MSRLCQAGYSSASHPKIARAFAPPLTLRHHLLPALSWVSRRVTVAILALVGAATIGWTLNLLIAGSPATDFETYWFAAQRLQGGQELYAPDGSQGVTATIMYRYSPWLAWVFVPLTTLPMGFVYLLWTTLLAVAAVYVSWPVRSHPVALALVPLLATSVVSGNVTALMLAGIAAGIRSGYGPFGIAIAASLKATPILLALYYVGRGEWRRFLLTMAATGLLVAPMLAYDLSHYGTYPTLTISLAGYAPAVYPIVAGLTVVMALYVIRRWPTYGWLAASVAVLAALPRFLQYDLSYLLIPIALLAMPSRSASRDEVPEVQMPAGVVPVPAESR